MAEREYSAADRLFHRIALSGRATPELFFDIEKSLHAQGRPDATNGAHIFVSGLARAGTTVLMRMLHDTGRLASLTYRDMPLVMAPNLWRSISGGSRKATARRERAHGDGLLIDFDSPEALEEVFWRTFCGPDYIGARTLGPMRAGPDVIEDFRIYVGLILKRYDRARYLSKNNNSILRLPSIAEAFPNAAILIPFRDPGAQAASLLAQHERFLKIHAEDEFSRRYMGWLAHHEFGADHRRFSFDGDENRDHGDASRLAYWVDLWIDVYKHLLKVADELGGRAIFVSHERLIADPARTRAQLFGRLGLHATAPLEVRARPSRDEESFPRREEARALYATLDARAAAALA